ncbi:MAG: glycosyltransferase family 4 protein, partial [Planctomycetales bacterium]|nr:glycosyltransferase family 4 protein [Planctomycetales bacterium]
PIVSTDVGGTSELIHDQQHALLVPPRDERSWCAAVQRCLQDAAATAERVAAARRRVEVELNFDRRLEKLSAIYESVVAKWKLKQD